MPIVENRESIKRRLQAEAARQWGVEEFDIQNGAFDPLVDLLFGAFAVETEKLWQEMEVTRSRVVRRMVEAVLPEVVTGIIPAHSVMMAQAAGQLLPTDLFSCAGSETVYFSPAGPFALSGARVQYIASGARIDQLGSTQQREALISLTGTRSVAAHTAWIGVVPPDTGTTDQLVLFLHWTSLADQARYLSYASSAQYFYGADDTLARKPIPIRSDVGIRPATDGPGKRHTPLKQYEETVREFYYPHFVTLNPLPLTDNRQWKRYPDEWETLLDAPEKALFQQELFWIKMVLPATIPPEALGRLQVSANCFPVLNRRLIRQRGKLQPMFNVYALTDEAGFLGIDNVFDGDGQELQPVSQKELPNASHAYSLRTRNLARFDYRDAFEKLNDLTAHLRDDLAAFNALDNSILNTHLETINRGIFKLREHLDTFSASAPLIYLLVRAKSVGTRLDVHFWTSLGSRANDIAPQTRLTPESTNQLKTDATVLLLPTSGGRDPLDDTQKQAAFREAILTRGKAVTVEDFRTIAAGLLGDAASSVRVKKGLSLGDGAGEGVRRTLEVVIDPNSTFRYTEEYWLKQAQLVKNSLEQRSTGVLPLFVSVEGFTWKI